MKQLVSVWKSMRRSFQLLGDAKKTYVLGVLLGSFEFALLFASPIVNQSLIDIVTGESDANIFVTLLSMLLLFILFVPPVIFGKYLQATSAAKGSANLRKRMFRHIAALPVTEQSRLKTGDLLTRLDGDVTRTTGIFESFSIQQLIRFAVVFPITLVLLLRNDWRIAVAAVLYCGINFALSLYLNPKARQQEFIARDEVGRSTDLIVETVRGLPVVRVFTLADVLGKKYADISGSIAHYRQKYRTLLGITYGVVDFFSQSAQGVGFLLGIALGAGSHSLGETVFNATLMGMMADAMYRLSTFLLLFQSHLVSMERVFTLLDEPTEQSGANHELKSESDIAVEFRGVSFAYGEKNVLNGISFSAKRGEKIAIVGGSGGGKSTVLSLMEGFYQPSGGEIFYYGTAGRELAPVQIRELFSYVPQECVLFDGTIAENIAMGSTATQSEVEAAARKAGVHEFIERLPSGYFTPVGELGEQLSGGQKQRIAIARAVLRNAPIFLFDEATAALDAVTEAEIQQCLDEVSADKTTISVAHRLTTVQDADRILVMDAGQIVEVGTFDELLSRKGRFNELYQQGLEQE